MADLRGLLGLMGSNIAVDRFDLRRRQPEA
jgi:hypothetical protein